MNEEARIQASKSVANNSILVDAFFVEKLASEKRSRKDSGSWLIITWKKNNNETLFTSKVSFAYNKSSGKKRRYYHDK